MANEMRDRLIELLNKTFDAQYTKSVLITAEHTADHLIENGVIVPPCKVGDVVYLIPCYNGNPLGIVQEDKVQMIGITSRGVHIKARNHHDHNKMYMLGKTVFLAKEQAEQKLKEMRGE